MDWCFWYIGSEMPLRYQIKTQSRQIPRSTIHHVWWQSIQISQLLPSSTGWTICHKICLVRFLCVDPIVCYKQRIYPDQPWLAQTLPEIQQLFINQILRPRYNPRQLFLQAELLLQNNAVQPIPSIFPSSTLADIKALANQTVEQHKSPQFLLMRPGRLSSNLFFRVYINMDNLGRFPYNIKQLAWLNKNAIAMFNYEDVDRHSVKYALKIKKMQ